jgi:hypothetical protein
MWKFQTNKKEHTKKNDRESDLFLLDFFWSKGRRLLVMKQHKKKSFSTIERL